MPESDRPPPSDSPQLIDPQSGRRVVARIATAEITSFSFSGPLPPPAVLAEYNRILPGLADRMAKMAEGQSDHRKDREREVIQGNVSAQRLGIIFSFIIVMTALLCGTFLIYTGHSAAGLVPIISGLAGLVAVFIYARQSQSEERAKKREDFQKASPEPPPFDE